MILKKFNFLLLIIFFYAPAIVFAQTFTNNEYGYSIEVDDTYQQTRNGNATYFRSQENDSLVVIKNWPGLSDEVARDYMQQGYQDARIALVSIGEPEQIKLENGQGMMVDIQGIVERKLMKGKAASFIGNGGQGMVVLVAAPNDDWDKLTPMAQQAIASVKFIDFSAGPDAIDWYYMLAGTRLSLRGTENDRSKREDLYFCTDGGFKHRVSASSLKEFDSGSSFGFSTRTGTGAWTVVDDDGKSRLMLRYSDGSEESAVVEDRNGQTYLDEKRFYMMRNHRCR